MFNKVRCRLANGKAARTASMGVTVVDLIGLDNLWKLMLSCIIIFIFLLVILVADE